jgi:hypothetical protein
MDVAGNNHGTNSGGTRVNGGRGSAISFNGSSNVVVMTASTTLNPGAGSFTFGFFGQLHGQSPTDAIMGKGNPVSGVGYGLYYTTGSELRGFIRDGSNQVNFDSTVIVEDELHSWAMTIDRVTNLSEICQDGVVIGSGGIGSIGSLDPTGRFSVGDLIDGDTARPSECSMNSAFAYNRVLSLPELRQLAEDQFRLITPAKTRTYSFLPGDVAPPTGATPWFFRHQIIGRSRA